MKLEQRLANFSAMHSAARVSLFGEFHLSTPDGTEIAVSNRRAKALLAMLCLARDESFDRDYLSKLLWPGRFEAHAKASLRQCLLDLGKLLTPYHCNFLDVTRSRVGLNAALVQTDLGALEAALTEQRNAEAAERLSEIGTRPLLDQLDLGDAFNGWLAKRRMAAELRLRAGVMASLAALEQAGDRAGHKALMASWAVREPPSGGNAGSAKPGSAARIAVLPFKAAGRQGAADYFADGMVDELITALGQVPQLAVTGRTSSFHFRGSDLPLAEIAAALTVSYLIEGSVQRAGEQVRVHTHLVDAQTGFELWGGRFDGTLDDVFALQEDVAQAVTQAIAIALNVEMPAPTVRALTQNKQAYDLYLQGQALCARRFGDGVLDTAVTLFEQALALDPDFAECWVALGEAHQLVSVYTQCLDRNGEAARMAECATRAIALSPRLAYPYSLLGLYELTRFNFVGALDFAYQAYRVEPGNPAVTLRLASFLMFIGRTQDAAPLVQAALDQDPADGRKYALLCGVQLCTGDLLGTIESGKKMVDLGMPSTLLAVATAALGNRDLAISQYLQTQQMVNGMILPPVGIGIQTPEAMDAYWLIAAKAICAGSPEDRQTYWQILEMLYAVLHDKSDLAISGTAVLTGNPELVFRTYGQCISASNLIGMLPLWSDIEPIRQVWQDPEFIPFAQRIGMAAAWDKYGWPDLLPAPSNR